MASAYSPCSRASSARPSRLCAFRDTCIRQSQAMPPADTIRPIRSINTNLRLILFISYFLPKEPIGTSVILASFDFIPIRIRALNLPTMLSVTDNVSTKRYDRLWRRLPKRAASINVLRVALPAARYIGKFIIWKPGRIRNPWEIGLCETGKANQRRRQDLPIKPDASVSRVVLTGKKIRPPRADGSFDYSKDAL